MSTSNIVFFRFAPKRKLTNALRNVIQSHPDYTPSATSHVKVITLQQSYEAVILSFIKSFPFTRVCPAKTGAVDPKREVLTRCQRLMAVHREFDWNRCHPHKSRTRQPTG